MWDPLTISCRGFCLQTSLRSPPDDLIQSHLYAWTTSKCISLAFTSPLNLISSSLLTISTWMSGWQLRINLFYPHLPHLGEGHLLPSGCSGQSPSSFHGSSRFLMSHSQFSKYTQDLTTSTTSPIAALVHAAVPSPWGHLPLLLPSPLYSLFSCQQQQNPRHIRFLFYLEPPCGFRLRVKKQCPHNTRPPSPVRSIPADPGDPTVHPSPSVTASATVALPLSARLLCCCSFGLESSYRLPASIDLPGLLLPHSLRISA